MFDGLFNFMRKYSHLYNSVQVTSKTSFVSQPGRFCYSTDTGSYPKSIIDGNHHLDWCNLNYDEKEQEVLIDFGINSFQLRHFVFYSACAAPNDLEILGSNDNNSFHTLCRLTDVNKDQTVFYRECQNKKIPFQFFKIEQHGVNNANGFRLHIREIEFFGILNPIQHETCDSNVIKYVHSIVLSFVFTSKE